MPLSIPRKVYIWMITILMLYLAIVAVIPSLGLPLAIVVIWAIISAVAFFFQI